MQRTLTGCGSTLSKLTLVIALGIALGLSTQRASAVDVFTDPVGFITLSAYGTDFPSVLANPTVSQYALGMTQIPASRGNATAAGANQVGISDTSVTAGQFTPQAGGPNPAYFLELTSGTYAGLMDDIVSNSAAVAFTADDLTSYIGGGTTYKIYPHWTVGTVFGPQNQAGFLGGSGSGSADNINVWNPNSQAYATYFFKTSGLGGTGWRSTTSASVNASNIVLYIDQGLLIARRTTGQVDVKLVGGVKIGTTISPVVSNGVTFAGNVFPAGQPLGSSTLYTGSPSTGLLGGSGSGSADNVILWNPATQAYITYFFKTSGLGGTGWRSTTSASVDASTNTIPLGASGGIVRRAGNGPFNWFAPQPFTQ